jgi:acyl-CoA reductase-like NAD-dependent aldehyde dehydrogenase
VRDAVRAARGAFSGWAGRSAYNRGQILFRLAEMLESRRDQFHVSRAEIEASIDRTLWYAGWCDKIEQHLSTKNAVSGPHFNVSAPEPTGVVAVVAPMRPGLLGLISTMLPPLCGGNAVVALASTDLPLPAVALAEALATADMPPGVVNILMGFQDELAQHLARHFDVNAISVWNDDAPLRAHVALLSAENVKRIDLHEEPPQAWWYGADAQSPRRIAAFMEIKTVWHPAGV